MERELFDWSGWDGEPDCMTFYEVVLKVSVGEFPAGTKFDGAIIMHHEGSGALQFYNLGPEKTEGHTNRREIIVVAEFKLHYRVGNRIDNSNQDKGVT